MGRFDPGSFRPWVVSAPSRFGPISIETEVVYGRDIGGCCWWGGVGPFSIGIETNERTNGLTGSAVITYDVTTGTGYCLVGFNWIIDFLN